MIFQSTLPQGERPWQDGKICFPEYFNPRSHKGSDKFVTLPDLIELVFQSTLPQGERPDPSPRIRMTHPISIHAPTRGATDQTPGAGRHAVEFQSTLPQGERLVSLATEYTYNLFQSTLPQGERRNIVVPVRLRHHISIHAPTRGATVM